MAEEQIENLNETTTEAKEESVENLISEIAEIANTNASDTAEETEAVASDDAEAESGETAEETAQEPDGETAEFVADDALVERAVRAGLSLADAKAFKSQESMERVLSSIEAKSKPAEAQVPSGDGEETPAVEDDIPDLDPEEFDENLVKMFGAMKSALKSARSEIASLKKAGESAREQSFFETEFGKLDDRVRAHVDAASKSKLMAKFNVLEAGYKAAKTDYDRADVFNEAVKLSLADAVEKAGAEKKEAAIAARKNLRIARPGGYVTRGSGQTQTAEEIRNDIISEIQRQINKQNS